VELNDRKRQPGIPPWRINLAAWVESPRIVPFIIIATFTILNLFIGIIVSTMQELSLVPDIEAEHEEVTAILGRIENDLRVLRERVAKSNSSSDS